MKRALQIKPTIQDKRDPVGALRFLEDFRMLQEDLALQRGKSKLISMKVPETLLKVFRNRCDRLDVKYQSQIKKLMMDWIKEEGAD